VMLHDGRIIARGAPADMDRNADSLVRAFMTSQHAG
jgi:ABC-type transporter Mla maintaining outer membrane lipid asymmetry ATPase subunit MlaF